jgi:hypothetical protein
LKVSASKSATSPSSKTLGAIPMLLRIKAYLKIEKEVSDILGNRLKTIDILRN